MERHREVFNDGFLAYGHKITQRSETGKRVGETFNQEGKLAFKKLSVRESDYQMAGHIGAKLDLKVKSLYPPSFRSIDKNKLKIVISTMEYDVIKVDADRYYLYFYLQEAGAANE